MHLTDPPADTPTTTQTPTARPVRLAQIDVMRLLICASVVATHVVGNANPINSVAPNAVTNLLHYTRQAFFFISALVLVHAYRDGLVRVEVVGQAGGHCRGGGDECQ